MNEIKKILYVGAGSMRCYNSLVSAMAGYDVVLYDISPDVLSASIQRQKDWLPRLVEMGRGDEKTFEAAIASIFRTTDLVKAAVMGDEQTADIQRKSYCSL